MIIIGISLLWVSFFSVGQMPTWLDFKPFNCVVCISFWSTMCLYLIKIITPQTSPYIDSLCIGGICAYTAIISKRIIFKI